MAASHRAFIDIASPRDAHDITVSHANSSAGRNMLRFLPLAGIFQNPLTGFSSIILTHHDIELTRVMTRGRAPNGFRVQIIELSFSIAAVRGGSLALRLAMNIMLYDFPAS